MNVAIAASVCRLIEESEDEPTLADLAAAVGLSPSYFHRRFKAVCRRSVLASTICING